MNQQLARQVREIVESHSEECCAGLGCEAQLRVAAATLADARLDMITATTVVGVLGQDDERKFEALITEIAREFGFEKQLRLRLGSFSVRFSRGVSADAEASASTRRPGSVKASQSNSHLINRTTVGR
jgi:hypothetical protein